MAGYKIIYNVHVHEARDLDEAAVILLAAREFGGNVRAKVRETLTSDRDLTAEEQAELVERAASLMVRA